MFLFHSFQMSLWKWFVVTMFIYIRSSTMCIVVKTGKGSLQFSAFLSFFAILIMHCVIRMSLSRILC